MTYESAIRQYGGELAAVAALSPEGQEHYAAAMAGAQVEYDRIRAANVGGYWKAKKEAERKAYIAKKAAWETCNAMRP